MPATALASLIQCCALVVLLTTTSGCTSIKIHAANGLMDSIERATEENNQPQLARDAMPAFLLILEGLIQEAPNNKGLALKAATAYTSYGTLLEYKDADTAHEYFKRGRRFALRALGGRPIVQRLLEAPFKDFQSIPNHLEREDLASIFWLASSWGGLISTNPNSMEYLAELPKVIRLMEWILQQDESFEHAAPHLFLGIYHAALPPTIGGDPQKSLFHFERGFELTGQQSLLFLTMQARYYARQTFDRTLHDTLLQRVINHPIDVGPADLRLQNALAKEIAAKLLEDGDEFF
jgi:hypothetical protein